MNLPTKSFRKNAVAAVLAIAFTKMSVGASSPALASIGQAFPTVSQSLLAMVATIPMLASVPASLLFGSFAGKKLSFRFLAVTSLSLVIIGGTLPFFSRTFSTILICRALLGFGLGVVQPMISSLVLLLFEGPAIERQMGNSALVSNLGGIIFQLFGGFLCLISWRHTFLIHLLIFPCLLIAAFLLPEPSLKEEKEVEAPRVLNPSLFRWCLLYMFYSMLYYPIITEISSIILDNGYGSAMGSAIVLTVFTGGGALGGYLFHRLSRFLRLRIFSAATLANAAGFALIVFGRSIAPIFWGSLLFGVGFGIFIPAITTYGGLTVSHSQRAAAASLLIIFTCCGGFLSPFFLSFVKGWFPAAGERFSFAFGAVLFLAIAIAFLFRRPSSHTFQT